jgi:hypothetical protein
MTMTKIKPDAELGTGKEQGDQTRKGNYIMTYTGTKFYPLDPRPDEMFIEDIAHALALSCRFTGHTTSFYSVAEHAVRMAKEALRQDLGDAIAFVALMHDASEAYIVDVPRPLKAEPYFGALYKKYEERIMEVVAEKWDFFEWPMPYEVKVLDNLMLNTEQRDLMPKEANVNGPWFPESGILQRKIVTWTPQKAEREFYTMYDLLIP